MGIFKAYDIRGVYPAELDERTVYRVARALVRFCQAKSLAVGRDVRLSSPTLAAAAIAGAADEGAEVQDLGLVTTPMIYYAVGALELGGGVMITASHNPPEYNGMKLCRQGAVALGAETGLVEIERLVQEIPPPQENRLRATAPPCDLVARYRAHLLAHLVHRRPLKVVVDTANGTVGSVFPKIFDQVPLLVIPLYFQPDGRFPNHEPDPLKDRNVQELRKTILEHKADLGAAFDGDGDRCMFFDARAERVPSDLVTALLAQNFLRKEPGAAIVYDLRSSRIVREEILRLRGQPVLDRVGHAFLKATMRRENAPFGGELSGHYYFRDHYFADSGLMAFVTLIDLLGQEGASLEELVHPLRRYFATGEINFRVSDQDGKIQEIAREFADGRQNFLDGITVEYEDWWFNVRKSNTEPLLRLNLEAISASRRDKGLSKLQRILGSPV